MNRTLIAEIIGTLVAIVIAGLVSSLWETVEFNKTHITELTEQIAAQKAAGNAEIRRSLPIHHSPLNYLPNLRKGLACRIACQKEGIQWACEEALDAGNSTLTLQCYESIQRISYIYLIDSSSTAL